MSAGAKSDVLAVTCFAVLVVVIVGLAAFLGGG